MGRNIKQLHPRLQTKIAELKKLCEKEGIDIGIGECYRTVAEQNKLYAKGRTEKGSIVTNAKGTSYSSQHQWGIAFDFYLIEDVDKDGKTSDDAFNNKTHLFNHVAALAKTLGLGWGGDWTTPKDNPHLYLKDWGSTPAELKKKYGTPDKFKETWKTTVSAHESAPKTSKPKTATTTAPKKTHASTGFKVRVTGSRVVVRAGAGINYKDTGHRATRGQVCTIVAQKHGRGASMWGKLKSGNGWISLDFATRRL